LARELDGLLARSSVEVEIQLQLAPASSLVRAYGYPVRVSQHAVGVPAGGLPAGETRSILLDLEVDCTDRRAKWVGKIHVDRRTAADPRSLTRVRQDLGVSCAPGRTGAPRSAEVAYVDLFARLARAADTLEVVLYEWDLRLLEEVERFLAEEQPRLRREAEALGDPQLLDLARFIDRGAVDMWAGVARMADGLEEREAARDPDQRLFRLRHYDTQMKQDRD
jgi:hypothetical protein